MPTNPSPTERAWSWIDDLILPYALAAMRAVWVWLLLHLWTRVVLPGRAELLPPLILFGLLATSTLVTQIRMFLKRADDGTPWFIALGGLAAVILTLYYAFGAGRADLLDLRWLSAALDQPLAGLSVVVPAGVLWYWGILTGREPLTYDSIVKNFGVGVLVLAMEMSLAYAAGVALPVGETLFPVLLVYFAISLSTLSIASLQSARSFERLQTGQSFAINRYWLGTVGLVICALLVIALLLGQIFAAEAVAPIRDVMTAIVGIIITALLWMMRLVFLVLYSVYEWIVRALLQSTSASGPIFSLPAAFNLRQLLDEFSKPPTGLQMDVFLILRAIALLIVAAMIVVVFILAVRRLRGRRADDDVEETRETILSLDLLKAQLAQLFARKEREATPNPYVAIRGDDARAQIRRTYQALLAWAADRGVPRPPGTTPIEYSALMSRELHLDSGTAEIITSAYLHARYGPTPISASRAGDVSRAWEQIARADQPQKPG